MHSVTINLKYNGIRMYKCYMIDRQTDTHAHAHTHNTWSMSDNCKTVLIRTLDNKQRGSDNAGDDIGR